MKKSRLIGKKKSDKIEFCHICTKIFASAIGDQSKNVYKLHNK